MDMTSTWWYHPASGIERGITVSKRSRELTDRELYVVYMKLRERNRQFRKGNHRFQPHL